MNYFPCYKATDLVRKLRKDRVTPGTRSFGHGACSWSRKFLQMSWQLATTGWLQRYFVSLCSQHEQTNRIQQPKVHNRNSCGSHYFGVAVELHQPDMCLLVSMYLSLLVLGQNAMLLSCHSCFFNRQVALFRCLESILRNHSVRLWSFPGKMLWRT